MLRPRSAALVTALALALAAPAARAQPVAESLGPRIVRWWPDADVRARALPSLALLPHVHAESPARPGPRDVAPAFPPAPGGFVAHVDVAGGTSLYGTGMVPGRLRRNGTTTTLWNTDAYGWGGDSPSLYQSHPWVLAVRRDGSAFGVLADDPGRIVIDLAHGIEFRGASPFAVIVIDRGSPDSVVMALADLTGHMPLPPKWALGWQQCRFSYTPDAEVRRIATEYRARAIPCDVLWVDIDYQDRNRPFTFDRRAFPDPDALNAWLHGRGFRSVWIVDPHIKEEPGYAPYDEGSAGGFWVRDASGADYAGRVWPGACVFPDVTRADARAWWGARIGAFARHGMDGIWNDMDEPAVFDVATKTMPESNVHRADAALGGPATHRRFHNAYGMLVARASFEGLRQAFPDRRPFVLSRANFLGGQKWAAAWTGDNSATWDHLRWSVAMTLNLGLSGQPFAGADIGGYAGAPDPALFARWVGVGTLLPFARAHSEKGTARKEPWAFGPAAEATCRRAIETRYRLLPYLYTVFREASVTGSPVARPLFFADPADAALRGEDAAFLLGRDVLVEPQLDEARRNHAALPRGAWRIAPVAAARGDGTPDPDLPVLRVRPGAIVPLARVAQQVGDASDSTAGANDATTLLVSLDASRRAEGTVYEDDGDGYACQRGAYRVTRFVAAPDGDGVRVSATVVAGSWPAGRRPLQVEVLTAPGERGVRVTRAPLQY